MAEPYGTIAKYRSALAIKKHNALIQAWASPMALDVATVFWATWKGIEDRLPVGEDIIESEKPRDSRDLKNKYSAIIRVEVQRHTPELQRVVEDYLYRVWLAGAVEQSRDLGCTGWFLSSLSKSSTPSESASVSEDPLLQEAPKVLNVKADKTGWVSLPNLRARAYAKKHAAEAVTQINDTTRKEIARIVSDGVKSGSSYNDIAKAIKSKFEEFAVPSPQKHIPNRAVLVAVTELANAYCEGNAQVGDYLQSNGVKMMKAWQTLEDDRVSDGCKENEQAGWIPIDKEFPSGHMHPPRFPGCRCDFMQEILDEDLLGKPISALYGKQYIDGVVKDVMKSPEKTVSSQVQRVDPEDRTKAGEAAAEREGKAGTPNWEEWDLEGIDDKFDSISDEDLRDEVMDTFERGDMHKFDEIVGSSFPEAVKLLRDKESSFSSMLSPFKRSVRAYTEDHYEGMNEYLRGGRKRDFSQDEDLVDMIMTHVNNAERAIRKYGVTTRPIVVNRGFEGDFWDTWKEGETRQLPEFVSTSVRSEGFDGRNVVHVYVPPNRGCGIYVDGESLYSNEWEYLIAPDSKFKVHHIEINEGEAGEVHEYWLELIP
nr:MAG TPA: minor capsid protein [Caudoviricetes sp.]